MILLAHYKVIIAFTLTISVYADVGEALTDRPVFSTKVKTAIDWTENFVNATGYPIETHRVTTEDGYILKMYRIPGSSWGRGSGPPVLLHHGFVGCAADWVVLGPEKSLAFLLADGGSDVWLANGRGSTESKSHLTLDSSDRRFWDFSWDEIGYYDLPAEIDYILRTTGRPTLSYVGFSMGTTAYWIMGATRPHYATKVNSMIALGPMAYMQHVRGPVLKFLAPLAGHLEWVVRALAGGEFLPASNFITWAARKFCKDGTLTQRLCSNVLFLLYGFQKPNLNGTTLARIFEFIPAGGSTKQFLHIAQLINKAPVFQKYDYGMLRNLWRYGRSSPPPYELFAVRSPVHVFMATNDWFSGSMDVLRLVSQLPDVRTIKLVKRNSFTHFDFLYAEDAPTLVYEEIIKILESIQY